MSAIGDLIISEYGTNNGPEVANLASVELTKLISTAMLVVASSGNAVMRQHALDALRQFEDFETEAVMCDIHMSNELKHIIRAAIKGEK